MKPGFSDLSEEKQLRILNAAMEVFGQKEYVHASTDDIAAKAGISKGLLFYYFQNKRALYLSAFDYCRAVIKDALDHAIARKNADLFELLEEGAREKLVLVRKNPYIMDFCVRAFYSDNEAISEDMRAAVQKEFSDIFPNYFQNLDLSRFREGMDPAELIRMLTWMADGYLHEKQRLNAPFDLDEIMAEYHRWAALFRRLFYKEAYWDSEL